MFNSGKKLIACITIVAIVVSIFSGLIFATEKRSKIEVNKELLESTLENRYWVIETLADGDLSNNPYIETSTVSQKQFLKDEILDNYEKDAKLKALVVAMEVTGNPGAYLSEMAEEEIAFLNEAFGTTTLANLETAIDDWAKGIDELRYESILNDTLLNNYTASWGQNINEDDLKMEVLRQRAEIYNNINTYQKALKTHLNLTNKNSSIIVYDPTDFVEADYEISVEDYTSNILDAYGTNLADYLDNTVNLPGLEGKSSLEGKILSSSALAMTLACEYAIGSSGNSDGMQGIFSEYICDDILSAMNVWGKMFSLEEYSINQAILLEAIINQQDTTLDTMQRMRDVSHYDDLNQVLDSYSKLFKEEGKETAISYNDIVTYVKNKGTVTNLVSKLAKKGVSSFLNEPLNYKGANNYVLSSTIADNISRAGAVVSLGVWLGDQATGIKDTSKYIYLCKYLDRIIAQAQTLYSRDLGAYYDNKTEENATKVINDLEFLKRLRLYGENIALRTTEGQLDSWLGALLSNDSDLEFQKEQYQAMVDALIGCSLIPENEKTMEISTGNELVIMSDNGYMTGTMMDSSSDILYTFPEADYNLMGGLKLNGSTLNIIETLDGVYIPNIECSGDSIITLGGNKTACDIVFGRLVNYGNLTIKIETESVDLDFVESIQNYGNINIVGKSAENISAYMIENSSKISVQDSDIDIYGNITNKGTINANLIICGDGSQPYDNGYFEYGRQVITGTGTCSGMVFNNATDEGVKVTGTQTVTGFISNKATKIIGGKNIQVTGNCEIDGGYFASDLSFKSYAADDDSLTVDGSVYIYDDVTFGADTVIGKTLQLTSECSLLTIEDDMVVKGDMEYSGGKVNGNGWLKLNGDLSVNTSKTSIDKLAFVGKLAQAFSHSYTSYTLNVKEFNNQNSYKEPVTLNGTITVSDVLHAGNESTYIGCKNIILTGTAKITGGAVKGSLSVKDWSCNNSCNISKVLYAAGAISTGENIQLTVGGYKQTEGTLSIGKDSTLKCSDSYSNNVEVSSEGTISVTGDSKITGDFTGGTFISQGDMIASAAIELDTLKLNGKTGQSFNNSSTTKTKVLTINNDSNEGVDIASEIIVSEAFNNNCRNLVNGRNIIMTGTSAYSAVNNSKGDISVTGEYVVPANTATKINGRLFVKSGATVTIESGAVLEVTKSIKSTSGTFKIAENGKLIIRDYLHSSSDTFENDGNIVIKGDAKLTSVTLNGNGLITFGGDLNTSSCEWNASNITFKGKLPQTVSGSAINTDTLTINNDSTDGITLKCKINYSGEFINNCNKINGENYLVKVQ